jgi:hypothetical protein
MRLLFRNATPDDWDTIKALHHEQQKAQGSSYELPFLFGPQFPVVLVGCDEEGIIRQCFYIESVAEMRFIGCDPKATALSQREAAGLFYVLKLRGFRWCECFVPRQLKKIIHKPLRRAGFDCVDKELSHYTRDLRGTK